MYSTCIFCHSSLGKNEAIEHFPVGRRLAFDEAKGRLWAVCAKCGRWNLTPLEERWEAIEECERQFRGTIVRSSTDQIGLARIGEGTDLIRIGKPLRPELAAWRYGKRFYRRKIAMRVGLVGGIATQIGAGVFSGSLLVVVPLVGTFLAYHLVSRDLSPRRGQKYILRQAEERFGRRLWRASSVAVRLISTDDEQGWGLRFVH